MIRCVRMWTGEDGDSLFEEGSSISTGPSRDLPVRPLVR